MMSRRTIRAILEGESVLFDDGNWYKGVITGKDPKTQLWVTIFEDDTEDFTKDPLNDKDYELMD